MIPFECDLCIFRKLRRCDPKPRSDKDNLLMSCIRRMNLDAFWSSSSFTVKGNKDKVCQMLKHSETVGLKGTFCRNGPMPLGDYCGYEVAVNMLLYSTGKGKRSSDHLQFDTIRKFQSTYGNLIKASPQSAQKILGLLDDKGRYKRLVEDPCASMFFQRFLLTITKNIFVKNMLCQT